MSKNISEYRLAAEQRGFLYVGACFIRIRPLQERTSNDICKVIRVNQVSVTIVYIDAIDNNDGFFLRDWNHRWDEYNKTEIIRFEDLEDVVKCPDDSYDVAYNLIESAKSAMERLIKKHVDPKSTTRVTYPNHTNSVNRILVKPGDAFRVIENSYPQQVQFCEVQEILVGKDYCKFTVEHVNISELHVSLHSNKCGTSINGESIDSKEYNKFLRLVKNCRKEIRKITALAK